MVQLQETHRPPSRPVLEAHVNVTAATFTARTGGLSIISPAYLDLARPKKESVIGAKRTPDAWVVVTRDTEEVESIHTEAQVVVTDCDLQVAGESIFAENQADFDNRVVAKALFEMARPTLANPGLSGKASEQWRRNVHWTDHKDMVTRLTARECRLEDVPYHLLGNGQHLPGPGVLDAGSCFDPNCHDRYFRTPATLKAAWPPELPQ